LILKKDVNYGFSLFTLIGLPLPSPFNMYACSVTFLGNDLDPISPFTVIRRFKMSILDTILCYSIQSNPIQSNPIQYKFHPTQTDTARIQVKPINSEDNTYLLTAPNIKTSLRMLPVLQRVSTPNREFESGSSHCLAPILMQP
jgi:hypothetical protein